MLRQRLSRLAVLCAMWGTTASAAPIESVLYAMGAGHGSLNGPLAKVGRVLYGTTYGAQGIVFSLTPPGLGQTAWTEQVVHTFDHKVNGLLPVAGLIADRRGALIGTTIGGPGNAGTIFRLVPPADGGTKWTESVLHEFGRTECAIPDYGVIADQTGALFGTSYAGYGQSAYGCVFRLTPPVRGQKTWTFTKLATFHNGANGGLPRGGLVADQNGALYGVTEIGGASGDGTVFRVTPPMPGQTAWTQTVIWSFDGFGGGSSPSGTLVFDHDGALYGTTVSGGLSNHGLVFRLTPPSGGQTAWSETVLHAFAGTDGSEPQSGVLMNRDGALFGTTAGGGSGAGTVFKLAAPIAGKRDRFESVLHNFSGGDLDGTAPVSGLVTDSEGNLFGTTFEGGPANEGVVFKIDR